MRTGELGAGIRNRETSQMSTNRIVKLWATTLMVVFGCLAASDARADHVVLTNHDALTGTVASVSKTDVTLNTEFAGRVTVKWASVSALTITIPLRVTLPTGQTIDGIAAVADGRFALRQASGAPVPVDLETVRGIELSTAVHEAAWHGALNAGVDVSRGNAETATVSTNGAVTRLGHADRFGLFGTYLFSSVGSGANAVTTARASRGGMRYDHDVLGRVFGFGFGDVENDPLQLLDLRIVGGGGAGAHVVKTDDTQLNLFAGVSYASDSYATATSTTTTTTTTTTTPVTNPVGKVVPGLSRGGSPPNVVRTSLSRQVGEWLIGQDFSRQLADSVNLTEGLTIYPAIGDSQDYRVSFDLSLSAQINGWLQWNVSVADRYLNIPPAGGAVQNDTFISTGLGITFGNGANGAYTGADGRRTAPPTRR
jgi:putative salt-induced outer membrane protein